MPKLHGYESKYGNIFPSYILGYYELREPKHSKLMLLHLGLYFVFVYKN